MTDFSATFSYTIRAKTIPHHPPTKPRRCLYLAFFVVFPFSAVLYAGESPCLFRPLVTATRCDSGPPTIDGDLTDTAWSTAGGSRFAIRPGDLANQMRITRDREHLYVAVRCDEPHMKTAREGASIEEDPTLETHEYVEVFLAVDDLSRVFHHFVVTIANQRKAEHGMVDNNDRFYQPWNGHWKSAVKTDDTGWQVEIAISLEDLGGNPGPGEKWGLALTRNRRNANTDYPGRFWWSPLVDEPDLRSDDLHAVYFPDMLGFVRFADTGTVLENGIDDLLTGRKTAHLTAFGLTGSEVIVRTGNRYFQGEGTWSLGDVSNTVTERNRQRLKAETPTEIPWSHPIEDEVVCIQVMDRDSGSIVYASGQRYRRPLTRDPIWDDIAASSGADRVESLLKKVLSRIESSSASYEKRLALWEESRNRVTSQLQTARRAGLMKHGPVNGGGDRVYGISTASPIVRILPRKLTHGQIEYESAISLQSARHEVEARQVIIYSPHQALEGIELTWTPLTGPGGAKIPHDRVWAAPVGFVETKTEPGYPTKYIGWWSDPILTYLDRFDAARGDLQPVWYSVRVAPDTPPGPYQGSLTLTPSNAPAFTVPVQVEVWDFVLPRTPSLKTVVNCNIVNGYKHEHPRGDPPPERLEPLFDKFHPFFMAHRCDPDSGTRRAPPSEKHIARFAELGVTCFSVFNIRPADLEESNPYKIEREVIQKYVADTMALAKKYGIEDRAFVYLPDEATAESFPAVEEMAAWLKAEFPNLNLLSTERIHDFLVKEIQERVPMGTRSGRPSLDWIVVPTGGWNDKHWGDFLREQGKELWWYIATGNYEMANFHIDGRQSDVRLLMGFMAGAYQPDGFLYWSMMSEINNPWPLSGGPYTTWNPESWDNHHGAGHLVYADPDGPVTSVRFENWLDGMEDFEYITLARSRVNAMDDGPVRQRLSATLAPYIDPGNEVVRSLSDYTTDPAVIESARRIIARIILQAE